MHQELCPAALWKPSKQPEEEKMTLRKKEIPKSSLRGTTGQTPLAPGKGSHDRAVPEGCQGLSVPPLHSFLMSLGLAWHLVWHLAWLGAGESG